VFKYGISKHKHAGITIRLTSIGDKLVFFCQNAILQNGSGSKRKGIGIANTRQRLDHMYTGKYRLDINTDNELFTVTLEIDYN
jgi:two-component system LytT family sensor kinase